MRPVTDWTKAHFFITCVGMVDTWMWSYGWTNAVSTFAGPSGRNAGRERMGYRAPECRRRQRAAAPVASPSRLPSRRFE